MFGLHPSLSGLHGMYADGDLADLARGGGALSFAQPFRCQDMMESGAGYRLDSGWLNRAAVAGAKRWTSDCGAGDWWVGHAGVFADFP
jgi:uncharacterized protein (DUF1501 family)